MSDVLNETPIAPEPRRWKPLLMGLALGLVVGGGAMFLARPKASAPQATQDTAQTWQCPMHPQIMQDHEGDCPICGMDLVEAAGFAAAQGSAAGGLPGLAALDLDDRAARLAGVRTGGVLLLAYAASAALAGLGGVVMASQLKSGAPTYGGMYELYVIAAVVVGGTSLAGGEGTIAGTLVGAFIIAVIQNGMNLTNVESYTQKVVLGLVILGAVLLDRLRRSRAAGS